MNYGVLSDTFAKVDGLGSGDELYKHKWLGEINMLYTTHANFIFDLCELKDKLYFSKECRQECALYIIIFCTI